MYLFMIFLSLSCSFFHYFIRSIFRSSIVRPSVASVLELSKLRCNICKQLVPDPTCLVKWLSDAALLAAAKLPSHQPDKGAWKTIVLSNRVPVKFHVHWWEGIRCTTSPARLVSCRSRQRQPSPRRRDRSALDRKEANRENGSVSKRGGPKCLGSLAEFKTIKRRVPAKNDTPT